MAASGGTATTKAMGKGSTQHQHLVQTEVPVKLLEEWLAMWAKHHQIPYSLTAGLRPHTAGSELLELSVSKAGGEKVATIVFDVSWIAGAAASCQSATRTPSTAACARSG